MTCKYEVEAHGSLDLLQVRGVLSAARLDRTREDYWNDLGAKLEVLVEGFYSQDLLTWEDYTNTLVNDCLKGSPWMEGRQAQLIVLATTNNPNAWKQYEEALGDSPIHVMAKCAMLADLLDVCAEAEILDEYTSYASFRQEEE